MQIKGKSPFFKSVLICQRKLRNKVQNAFHSVRDVFKISNIYWDNIQKYEKFFYVLIWANP